MIRQHSGTIARLQGGERDGKMVLMLMGWGLGTGGEKAAIAMGGGVVDAEPPIEHEIS